MSIIDSQKPIFHSEQPVIRRRTRIGFRPTDDYKVIQAQAVLSLVLGVLSIFCFFTVYLFWIPLGGLIFGWIARKEIAKSPKERLGLGMAQTGMILSLVFGVLGCGWVMYTYLAEAPPGYKLITFAELQPDPNEPKLIPQFARDLEEKKVFVWGYMVPGEKQYGITDFVLVEQLSHCQFLPVPASAHPDDRSPFQKWALRGLFNQANWSGWRVHVEPGRPQTTVRRDCVSHRSRYRPLKETRVGYW